MSIDKKKLKEMLSQLNLLYVEDEEDANRLSTRIFEKLFNKVVSCKNGLEGLNSYKKEEFDIVISDINMPKMTGLEMIKEIKSIFPQQSVIITTAYSDSENLLESIKLGVEGYVLKPIDMEQVYTVLEKVCTSILNKKENEYYKANLEELVQQKIQKNSQLEKERSKNYEETILALVNMVEIRDSYTSGHSLRVATYSKKIVEKLALGQDIEELVYQAGILHDIGKIAIPDSILLKPNSLNPFEFDLMKKHSVISSDILEKIPMYKNLAIYVKHHHERYDGSGYPDGLKADEIPLVSQIMAIADTFDAMTTSRIYKPRKNKKEALDELKSLANKSFSKSLVDTALEVFKDIELNFDVNQLPTSDFEEQRFSFFYKDRLTNIYNTEYLDLVLNKNSYSKENNFMTIVLLHNFSDYNKINGWSQGDIVLQKFSTYLKDNFIKDSMLFRFRGDDFIVLDKFEFKDIDILQLEDYGITIDVFEINLENLGINSFNSLNDYFDKLCI